MTEHIPVIKRILAWLLMKSSEKEISISILDYLSEKYTKIAKEKSLFKALFICIIHFSLIIVSLIFQKFIWSFIMLKNYLKISLRRIFREKGYSFLNIFGLSVGLTCCIFIFLYVRYETSYDSFHKDADRVFRIIASRNSATGTTVYGGTAHQLTPYVKENFKQAEYIAKVTPWRADQQVKYGDKIFNEAAFDIPFADEDIFQILSYKFIEGDPQTALSRPKTAVLCQSIAQKYFGDENPMGKLLLFGEDNFEITGVIEDPPGNTVFKFKILRSWKTLDLRMFYPRWMNFHTTFVKLAPGVDPKSFARLLTQTIVQHAEEDLKSGNMQYTSILQPIKEVYLNSNNLTFERVTVGKKLYIYIFSGIGIFILVIASINFMNLVTARSSTRACEVGIRKVVGAHRRQLFNQFIGESLLMTAISFFIALAAVFLLLNKFNELSQLKIEYSTLVKPDFIFSILAAVIVLGFAAGNYPALILSSFKPISGLRGTFSSGKKGQLLRKVLVIGQYTFSIALITGVILFYSQLNYMKKMPLGFENKQKLIINMQGTEVGMGNYISVKDEFKSYPSVLGAAFSSGIPGRTQYYSSMWPSGQRETNTQNVNWIDIDSDFIPVYGLEIIAGKNLSDAEAANISGLTGLLNETAVKVFGFNSPGEVLDKSFRDREGKIAGVVRDFHFEGLQKAIEPHMMVFRGNFRYLTLNIAESNISRTISFVEDQYKALFPGRIFEYFFLDEEFDKQYRKEEQTAAIFGIFTFMGILIASLGLVGLAAFVAQKRTKEIGIRKVMGASSKSIVSLLTREFLYLVLAANIIAWPLSYFIMNKWFQSFAYRINIGLVAFVIAGLTAVLIAVISVSYLSFKAANKNPVDSLKYE
ncbi:ABC transporter permease [candidate division KSB1 bacterium]